MEDTENKDNNEKKEIAESGFDIKGTIGGLLENEKPELTQEEEIKAYREPNNQTINNIKKKKKSSDNDEDDEDDEYLKKLKRELLASLERVNLLAKKIFGEKNKANLKDFKSTEKSQKYKSKNREQTINQMQQNVENEKGRSRE